MYVCVCVYDKFSYVTIYRIEHIYTHVCINHILFTYLFIFTNNLTTHEELESEYRKFFKAIFLPYNSTHGYSFVHIIVILLKEKT